MKGYFSYMKKFTITSILFGALLALSGLKVNAVEPVCLPAGDTGMTAHYINEVPVEPLEVTCDIGVYFNEQGEINDVEILGTVASALPRQYGVYIDGSNVNLNDSVVDTEEGYPHQFASVVYVNGASGNVRDNIISGEHRVGLLVRGEETNVNANGNEIMGTGPKTARWAENGIQIDQMATATLVDNYIADHWYNKENWVSSGILAYGSGPVVAHRNHLLNNDLGAYLIADGSNFHHNTVEITYEEPDIYGLYGVYVYADDVMVAQNTITSSVERGLGLGVLGSKNKLIKNDVSGWEENTGDYGTDTVWPKPFRE